MVRELSQPIYAISQPAEGAIAECVRRQDALLIEDMIQRGMSALEADARSRRTE